MDLYDLYSRYARDVRRFALYLCGNEALADDLTSETFLRAWSSSAPIRESTVKAYLFTIVRHLYLSEVRRASRHAPLTDTIPSAAPDQHEEVRVQLRGQPDHMGDAPGQPLPGVVLPDCGLRVFARVCADGPASARVTRGG